MDCTGTKDVVTCTCRRELWQLERGILEGEALFDSIEEIVSSDVEGNQMYPCFKLLCLQSICSGGLSKNRYDQMRQLMVHAYGMI